MRFAVLISSHYYLLREKKMADCPNCEMVLNQDFLDLAMDQLKNGIANNIVKIHRECTGCQCQIEFQNNGGRYYVVLKDQSLVPIGAR
ncbi:hypothetical protein [Acinetobacter baumannii]|uniref:hypothetical protein n=1 Tax=Acinetobacter baumannii TaxID=470 RepID=UPI003FA4AB82